MDDTKSVRAAFAGRHILVTGVTGYLGKVWLSMVLHQLPEVRAITVLARGKMGDDADARFHRIVASSPALRPLREEHGVELWDLVREKVEVYDAKLSAEDCGLDAHTMATRIADVDVVVHFAGLTDFEPDPLLALDANVRGAVSVADLAAKTRGRRYIHVSTTFVAGIVNGEVKEHIERGLSPTGVRFDPDQELAEVDEQLATIDTPKARIAAVMDRAQALGWPNIYTYSKGLAEHLLCGRTDITNVSVRPAIVECARSFPFTGWNEGINTSGPIIWLLGTAFRRFPAGKDNHFDVIPVDTVCRGVTLATAACLRGEAKEIYQLASSGENPFTFARAVELTGLAHRRIYNQAESTTYERLVLRNLEPHTLSADKKQLFDIPQQRRVARALRSFLKAGLVTDNLPPRLHERFGEDLVAKVKSTSMQCRTADRKLGTVEDMLRAYRPFIHDYNYTFRTENTRELSDALPADERELFGFDIDELCWRQYWLDVQVPGLDKWCIPLLRGDKVPDDSPLPEPDRREHVPTIDPVHSPALTSANL